MLASIRTCALVKAPFRPSGCRALARGRLPTMRALLVTLLAAQGWRTALVGGITMASIDLDLIGVMLIWDIKLNPPAFVCLVMAVGLAVDYCVHIAHGFEEVRSRPPPFIMRETRRLPNQLSRAAFSALLHAGANMAAEDNHKRTPLFVASAMNREDCVAFLIDVLESEEEMHHSDHRGDTPLHAAACNGAEACVLLLLQSGMDPNVRNRKGFRPIELAAFYENLVLRSFARNPTQSHHMIQSEGRHK